MQMCSHLKVYLCTFLSAQLISVCRVSSLLKVRTSSYCGHQVLIADGTFFFNFYINIMHVY